jgi:hypothetical protein
LAFVTISTAFRARRAGVSSIFFPEQLRQGTVAVPAVPPNGFVQAAGGVLAGVPEVEETLVPSDKNNLSPRVGFALRLNNSASLMLRGGYGIYYDRFSTRYANTQLLNIPISR